MLEFTYVMIKPDGVEKKILPDVIDTFQNSGLDTFLAEYDNLDQQQVEKHYEHLKERDFFGDLVNFMTSGKVIKMIVFGDNAISKVRSLIGPTNVTKAKEEAPYSIRAKYGNPDFGPANAIHASDSKESAVTEIERFFGIKVTQPELVKDPKVNIKINKD